MPTYVKPNGKEIEINAASVPTAERLGWKVKKPSKKKPSRAKKVKDDNS